MSLIRIIYLRQLAQGNGQRGSPSVGKIAVGPGAKAQLVLMSVVYSLLGFEISTTYRVPVSE